MTKNSASMMRFCPEARSGELPPASLRALWRQRLRWEIGWDQVSLSYFRSIYRAKDISCRKKFALYYWLPWRWLMLTTSAINAFVTPIVTMTVPAEAFGYPLRLMMDASLICFVLVTSFILCNAVLIARPREIPPIIIFQLFGMFYLLWNATIVATSLFRIATGLAGGHGFVPTQRDHAGARGGTTGQLETARMSDGFLEAKVGPIAADDAANDAALETDTRREASRSRVTTVAACAPPEGHMHESAFGWNFAAPENLEPVEIISPNSRAARIPPTMVGRV